MRQRAAEAARTRWKFGYARDGSNVEAAMQAGITVLLKRGVAEDQGGRIALR